MDSVPSPEPAAALVADPRPGPVRYLPSTGQTLMKLVVTGPFGVGKTTLILSLIHI